MMMPTARSTTLPRMMNARNSVSQLGASSDGMLGGIGGSLGLFRWLHSPRRRRWQVRRAREDKRNVQRAGNIEQHP